MTFETLTNESLTLSQNLASTSLTMAQVNPIVINLLVGTFLLISIIMILIVLIQRPQGGGLGGAFGAGGGGGGGGAGQTAFGTKTGDVLTGGTIAIFVLFIVFAIVLNFVTRPPEAPAEQPTLSAPGTTEVIPEDEAGDQAADVAGESIEDTANTGLERAGDAADAAEDLVEDLETETQPAADPQDEEE